METTINLDFLKISGKIWHSEFKRIAEVLFNNYRISANKTEYDIVEVEFYYDSPKPNEHKDIFIYSKTEKNLTTGNWLFHLSGIDLTFGDLENKSRGGILIRAIKKTDGSKLPYVIGPWRTMLEILNHINPIQDGGELRLQLVPKTSTHECQIKSQKRKGINPEKKGAKLEYRFIADIETIKVSIPSLYKQYYEEPKPNPK